MPGEMHKKQTWYGDMVKARERIQVLCQLLGPFESYNALQESERPAKHLLEDENVADLISYRLVEATSGKGNDEVCQWLFDTYQSQDVDLQLVVLRFIPTLCGIYLPRVTTCPDEPLAGFEAVLLALYGAETKARGGRPVVINIPDLGQASLYHTPRHPARSAQSHVEIIAPALEPQISVKSTKRAAIVGVTLELFCKRIAAMPLKAKLDLCHYARSWAIKGCCWANEVDSIAMSALPPKPTVNPVQPGGVQASPAVGAALTIGEALTVEQEPLDSLRAASSGYPGKSEHDVAEVSVSTSPDSRDKYHETGEFQYQEDPSDGPRVPLELDLLRPIFKVLGHCLMAPSSTSTLKVAAVDAAKAIYARASHSLLPEAILASRSLIRLGATFSTAPSAAEPLNYHRAENLVKKG